MTEQTSPNVYNRIPSATGPVILIPPELTMHLGVNLLDLQLRG